MKKSFLTASVVLLCVLCLGVFGFAQSDTGTINGTVTDAQGAVISNATVTATNTGTNKTYTAKSDSRGSYTIPGVVRGPYHVEIKADGFKSAKQDFLLNISEQKDFSASLTPGSVSESVTVDAGASVVDTTTSSTGEVITGQQVTELPLNGRNFTQLALLTPGVTRGAYGSQASGVGNNAETFRYNQTGGAALSVNGLRQQANNYTLDGVDNNESLVNSIVFFPPVEATQEFRVNTSVAPAEFGRAGGGIIQTSIKSGSNQWHGSAFDFLRNSVFDANAAYFDPITNGEPTKKKPFRRNQFGGTLGGAIIKNKLFIFGDYQGFRDAQPQNPQFTTVPTAKMRTGDFSELLGTNFTHPPSCAPAGSPVGAIFDPTTCQPFTGNIIPSNMINAVGLKYLNAFPAPNVPGVLQNNFTSEPQVIENYNDFDIRADYNLSSKDTLFGRYSFGNDDTTQQTVLGTLPSGFGSGGRDNKPRGIAFGETHTFGATLLNDFRFGYLKEFYDYANPFNNVPVSQNLGIPGANRLPELGGGALIGPGDNSISYTGDGGPYIVNQDSMQFQDAVSWIRGNHSFKFGANVIRREVDIFQSDYRGKGFFQIGNGDTTGYPVAELLAGFMNEYDISSPINGATYSWETGYFAQDDWKVTSRLTLNLGLRYDLYTNPYEEHNQWSNFNLATGVLEEAGKSGSSRSLVNTDKNNLAPRIGFAYDLFGQGKTILRGGFGIFYFLDRGGVGNQLIANPDWTSAGAFTFGNGYRITLSGQGPNNNNDPNAVVAGQIPGPTSSIDLAHPTNTQVLANLPNNQNSAINEWNLQLTQELGHATEFNVAYVGNRSDHLMTIYNANGPHLVGFAGNPYAAQGLNVIVEAATGTSNYNGLQTSLNHRMTNGLQFTAAYTWSHALDNSRSAYSNVGSNQQIFTSGYGSLLQYNYGNSEDDQRHAFTFASLYELPFGHGKRWGGNWNSFTNQALGGWQFNIIASLGTGTPFDIIYQGNNCNNCQVHPLVLGNVSTGNFGRDASNNNSLIWMKGSFAPLPQDANGNFLYPSNMEKNQFYGPGYNPVDVSIFKNFALTERLKMEFRAEAYNLLNTPQLVNPNSGAGCTSGASICNGNNSLGEINATRAYSERELQFALRFTF